MKEQSVTFYIYPEGNPQGEQWTTSAYVVGDWAVHRPHPRERSIVGDYSWHITHTPSGVLGFVSKSKYRAIQAAKRLREIEQPTVEIAHGEPGEMPHVVPLSLEWVQLCGEKLQGLDVLGVAAYALVTPERLYQFAQESRGIIAFD